jgi:hypothetical protein
MGSMMSGQLDACETSAERGNEWDAEKLKIRIETLSHLKNYLSNVSACKVMQFSF